MTTRRSFFAGIAGAVLGPFFPNMGSKPPAADCGFKLFMLDAASGEWIESQPGALMALDAMELSSPTPGDDRGAACPGGEYFGAPPNRDAPAEPGLPVERLSPLGGDTGPVADSEPATSKTTAGPHAIDRGPENGPYRDRGPDWPTPHRSSA